jgi:DNA-binding transcriptional MocR family regulator
MARRPSPAISLPRPDPGAGAPLYLQVVSAIEHAIQDGRLQLGQRLPAERRLAVELGVSRTTATNAYRELEARGLVRGHVGRGTTVLADSMGTHGSAIPWQQRASRVTVDVAGVMTMVQAPNSQRISFAQGWPDRSLQPHDLLDRAWRTIMDDGPRYLYGPAAPEGDLTLREALTVWLRGRGLSIRPDQCLITTGAQAGLNVVARAFVSHGQVVLTETPTWMGAILAFRWAGADVIGIPMDRDGIQLDPLEDALARYRPSLLYLMPSFQHPAGTVLSRERRRQVLEMTTRFRVPVLESDLYGDLHFEAPAPPPLKALDALESVIYQGSFSKIGAPGVRVGWLVAPTTALPILQAAKVVADVCTATGPQQLVARALDAPAFDLHLARLRRGCRERRDALVAALRRFCPMVDFNIPGGGYYLWVRLPAGLTAGQLLPVARERGVDLRPGPQFVPDGGGHNYVRLCFASVPTRDIEPGVRRLGEALRQLMRPLTAAVSRGSAEPLV